MMRGVALLALALWSTPVLAEKVGVIESHVLTRAPEASRLMPAILDAYGSAGYFVGPSGLGQQLEQIWGAPGREMSPQELSEAQNLVDKGYRAWIQGDFPEAVKLLTRGLDRFLANPATLARDPLNRQAVFKALVYKAAAHRRLNETDQATATMAELIRSYPDTQVSRSTHGPEAFEFYQAVRQSVTTQGRGQLIVDTDDSSVVIFLNGRYEGVGRITKMDLVPGEYRVYLQKGTVSGRLHKVIVESNRETKLTVDWVFESSLVTGPDWVGFAFLTRDLQQKHEAAFAKQIGSRLTLVTVIIHTFEAKEKRRQLVGRVLGIAASNYPRSGMLELDPVEPTPGDLKGLAVYLGGGPRIPPIKDPDPPKHVEGQPQDKTPSNPWVIPAWSSAAVAAGTIGVGVFFLIRDGKCATSVAADTQCPTLHDTLLPGIGLTLGGVAIGGLSTWMFLKASRWRDTTIPVAFKLTRGGGILSFSGKF